MSFLSDFEKSNKNESDGEDEEEDLENRSTSNSQASSVKRFYYSFSFKKKPQSSDYSDYTDDSSQEMFNVERIELPKSKDDAISFLKLGVKETPSHIQSDTNANIQENASIEEHEDNEEPSIDQNKNIQNQWCLDLKRCIKSGNGKISIEWPTDDEVKRIQDNYHNSSKNAKPYLQRISQNFADENKLDFRKKAAFDKSDSKSNLSDQKTVIELIDSDSSDTIENS